MSLMHKTLDKASGVIGAWQISLEIASAVWFENALI